ncbi:hypothetical protein ONQ97_25970, partial [Salmonella enterica subsp. enterica serovar Virginia]|nr:hypothetical protein [Salmonella enterica subsp. enterica serovar Virginia]
KLGILLGLTGNTDRRIRSFRNGERPVPYGVWRRFLIITGRVSMITERRALIQQAVITIRRAAHTVVIQSVEKFASSMMAMTS